MHHQRVARRAVVLATAALLAPTMAQATDWHRVLKVGKGKTKVKVKTCNKPEGTLFKTRYKAVTRKSSDRHAPRIEIRMVEGSHQSNAEFSLFPGDLKETGGSGPWSAAAVMKITVRHRGKVKRKTLTVGQIGPC